MDMTAQPHTLELMLLCLIAVTIMMKAGLAKRALEIRQRKRTCPSCGKEIKGRVCKNH